MTIFNSTLDTMKKNINSGQGIIYSVFNGNKITQKDIQNIMNYSNALQNGVGNGEAWRNNMRSCSVAAKQYVRDAKAAGKSTDEIVAGLKNVPKVANISQTALKGVAIAGNMLAMIAISEAISLTIKGIDYLVHYEEKQAEAFKKASESTKQISEDVQSLKSGMSDTASKAKGLSSEYAKLVQGVNAFTNENKSLSTKNYERFLELNTQLAELFPSLTKKYDDNGNAILGLSGGVDSVTASIERLVEQQNNLAKIEIREKLDEYIEGTDDSDGIFKSLEGYKKNAQDAEKELSDLENTYNSFINKTGRKTFTNTQRSQYYEDIRNKFGQDAVDALLETEEVFVPERGSATYTIDFSKLELDDKTMGRISQSYDAFYRDLKAQADLANSELDTKNREMSSMMMTWVEDSSPIYKSGNDPMKRMIETMVSNLKWSDFGIKDGDADAAKQLIQSSILTPLNAACENPDSKSKVMNAFNSLFSAYYSDMPYDKAKDKIKSSLTTIMDALNAEITDEGQKKTLGDMYGLFGFENYNENDDSIKPLINNVKEKLQNEFDGKVGELTLGEIKIAAEQIEVPEEELLSWDELLAKIHEIQSSAADSKPIPTYTDRISQIQSLSQGFNQLSKIYEDVSDGNSFDWSSILNNEEFKEVFGEFSSIYDDFIQTVSNAPDDIEACQSAFDQLSTAYLSNSDALKYVTADTKDATVSMLEQMGISNALEIVTNSLTLNEQTLADAKSAAALTAQTMAQSATTEAAAKEALRLSSIDLENATLSEINDLITEANQLNISSGALINLKLAKFDVSRQSLNLMEDVSSLLAMAKAANISSQAVVALAHAQAGYNAAKKSNNEQAMRHWASEMEGQRKLVEAQVSNFQVPTVEMDSYPKQPSTTPAPSTTAAAAETKETKETFNFIETAINRISSAIDKVKSKAEETFGSFSSRSKSYSEAIRKISEEINIQNQAKQKYTTERNKVGLDESWAAKVRDGSLDIAEVSDSSLKEKIREYQKWNDMVNECSDSISDLKKEQDELIRDKLELLITKYEKLSTKASNANDRIQNRIDLRESWGGSAKTKDYAKMNKNLSKQVGYTKNQNSELRQLQKTVTKGSEAWYDYQEQIDKNNSSVQNLTKSMVENAKAAAALAKEKAASKVKKRDSKDELYDAKIENATSSQTKNKLIDKKIDNIGKRQSAYDTAYETSSKNLDSASSSITSLKKKGTKTKNAAKNKANKDYNDTLADVKAKIKDGKKIPAKLLEKARKLNDNAKLYNACVQYNEYFDAKAENKEIADIYRETSQQDKAELTLEKFNNTAESYDNSLRSGKQRSAVINNRIALANEQGKSASASDYKELIAIEKQNQSTLINKRKALQDALDEAVKDGSIKENSEEWYEMKDAIDAVTNEIDESTRSVVEYQNAMRQLEWDKFDKGMETLKRGNSERDYQINMFSHKKLVDDETGDFTDEGKETLKLRKSNYQNYLSQAAKYQQEYQNLQKQIAKGELDADDEKVIARLRELEDAHHDVMLSAEDEKDSIADLIKEGYNAQLDSLSKLIQKYKDVRQNAKDAYDYQKSISEKTKNIASLQKQLAAYGSNNTEEARAKIQQLKVDLENAQQDLKDAEYEKYLSDTNDMLDELYSDYEAFIDKKLEDTDALLENIDSSIINMSDSVSTVLSSINQTNEDLIKALAASPSPQNQGIYSMGLTRLAVPNPISDLVLPEIGFSNTGYGNAVNISIGDIVLQDVQNPEQFSRQLVAAIADNSRVQRSIQSVSVDRLVRSNGLNVNRFK